MWIYPKSGQVFTLHSEIRAAFPDTSFPTEMSEAAIASAGLLPVTLTHPPTFDALTQKVVSAAHEEVEGAWVQRWSVEPLSPEDIPQVVTIRQARIALLREGLLGAVLSAVALADQETRIDWEFATEVQRRWPTLIALQPALGWTDAQIDRLFVLAATI